MKAKVVKKVKSLHVPLTQEEFNEHAIQLAKMMSERDALENKIASMRSAFKAQMDEASAKISRERQLVQEGKEWRDVHCTVTYDYDAKTVTTTQSETGELVEERAMRLDEMQIELDLEEQSVLPDETENTDTNSDPVLNEGDV